MFAFLNCFGLQWEIRLLLIMGFSVCMFALFRSTSRYIESAWNHIWSEAVVNGLIIWTLFLPRRNHETNFPGICIAKSKACNSLKWGEIPSQISFLIKDMSFGYMFVYMLYTKKHSNACWLLWFHSTNYELWCWINTTVWNRLHPHLPYIGIHKSKYPVITEEWYHSYCIHFHWRGQIY